MLFVLEERLVGLKHNIDLGERVGLHRGESIGMFTVQKGAIL